MHQQIRTKPARSPADLGSFLDVLAKGGVNIIAAGGGDVEGGGEFAFAVEDGQYEHALEVLRAARYDPRIADEDAVDHKLLPDTPGALHGFVSSVRAKNKQRGYVIRDVSVGTPHDGRILVQIYSEPA